MTIQIDDNGQVGITSHVPDHIQAIGLLELAKECVKASLTQKPDILLARGALPPVSSNGH